MTDRLKDPEFLRKEIEWWEGQISWHDRERAFCQEVLTKLRAKLEKLT